MKAARVEAAPLPVERQDEVESMEVGTLYKGLGFRGLGFRIKGFGV